MHLLRFSGRDEVAGSFDSEAVKERAERVVGVVKWRSRSEMVDEAWSCPTRAIKG
jgi:hypothetical protein